MKVVRPNIAPAPGVRSARPVVAVSEKLTPKNFDERGTQGDIRPKREGRCVDFTQHCAYHAQMLSRCITFADLAAVGRTDRHRLRNLLKGFPEFARRSASERVASQYTPHDLTVVAVLCELDRMGLRKDAIAKWVSPIQETLQGPRSIDLPPLFLTCDPPQASLADHQSFPGAGVMVDLDRVLSVVDNHCNGLEGVREQQRELEFGPTGVAVSQAVETAQGRSHG